jgi:hypothetical protein
MSEDPTSEELARYNDLLARNAAAHARVRQMLEEEREREFQTGRFLPTSPGDNARAIVKEFLLLFFGAAVLLVPASLGAIFLLLTLIGVDISDISNVFAVIVWLGASIGFAYWGVGRH